MWRHLFLHCSSEPSLQIPCPALSFVWAPRVPADPGTAGGAAFSVLPSQRAVEANLAPPSHLSWGDERQKPCLHNRDFYTSQGQFKEETDKSVEEATREDTSQPGEHGTGGPSIRAEVPAVEACQGVQGLSLATRLAGHFHQALGCLTRACRLT